MYTVIGTNAYLKALKKWPRAGVEEAEQLPKKLAQNPTIGKPLTYPFLREKKIGGRRIYYLIYDDLKLVLLIATSGKKDQQATINHIKFRFKEFRAEAERIAKLIS